MVCVFNADENLPVFEFDIDRHPLCAAGTGRGEGAGSTRNGKFGPQARCLLHSNFDWLLLGDGGDWWSGIKAAWVGC